MNGIDHTGGHLAHIDHEWLRRHLGWTVYSRDPIEVTCIGRPGGSTCGVYRIGCGHHTLVYKAAPRTDTVWGRWISEAGAVEREAHTYRFLADHVPHGVTVAPRCYWTPLDLQSPGGLALEDLGAHGIVDPSAMARGLTYPQALAAVRTLAAVHAATAADRHTGTPPHPWLLTTSSPQLHAAVRTGLDDAPTALHACHPDIDTPAVEAVIAGIDVERELIGADRAAHLAAVCHGDLWAGNIVYTVPDPPGPLTARLIDWQFTMWGNPLTDLALLLLSSLDPAHRHDWQPHLLRRYHTALVAHSGLDYSHTACDHDLHVAQSFAALVALATIDGYTAEMTPTQRRRFAPRMLTALDLAAAAPAVDGPDRTIHLATR